MTDALRRLAIPIEQVLVAGVIDGLTSFVEHPEVVADRVDAVVGDPTRAARGCCHRRQLAILLERRTPIWNEPSLIDPL
jgi:hypothetical protein